MYIVQVKYRSGDRWNYAYFNALGNITTVKSEAHKFNRLDNAQDFARILTKNKKYIGRVKNVD